MWLYLLYVYVLNVPILLLDHKTDNFDFSQFFFNRFFHLDQYHWRRIFLMEILTLLQLVSQIQKIAWRTVYVLFSNLKNRTKTPSLKWRMCNTFMLRFFCSTGFHFIFGYLRGCQAADNKFVSILSSYVASLLTFSPRTNN